MLLTHIQIDASVAAVRVGVQSGHAVRWQQIRQPNAQAGKQAQQALQAEQNERECYLSASERRDSQSIYLHNYVETARIEAKSYIALGMPAILLRVAYGQHDQRPVGQHHDAMMIAEAIVVGQLRIGGGHVPENATDAEREHRGGNQFTDPGEQRAGLLVARKALHKRLRLAKESRFQCEIGQRGRRRS